MKYLWIILICTLSFLYPFTKDAFSTELNKLNQNYSISFEAGATPQASTAFRLVWAYWIPKSIKLSHNINASLRLELDMGILDTTDTAFDIGFQPVVRIGYHKCKFKPYLDLGAGIHFLSRANIDNRKLGGGHQFSLLAGTGFYIGSNISLGYRYFHISNANIHSHNHGRDEHLGVISFYF